MCRNPVFHFFLIFGLFLPNGSSYGVDPGASITLDKSTNLHAAALKMAEDECKEDPSSPKCQMAENMKKNGEEIGNSQKSVEARQAKDEGSAGTRNEKTSTWDSLKEQAGKAVDGIQKQMQEVSKFTEGNPLTPKPETKVDVSSKATPAEIKEAARLDKLANTIGNEDVNPAFTGSEKNAAQFKKATEEIIASQEYQLSLVRKYGTEDQIRAAEDNFAYQSGQTPTPEWSERFGRAMGDPTTAQQITDSLPSSNASLSQKANFAQEVWDTGAPASSPSSAAAKSSSAGPSATLGSASLKPVINASPLQPSKPLTGMNSGSTYNPPTMGSPGGQSARTPSSIKSSVGTMPALAKASTPMTVQNYQQVMSQVPPYYQQYVKPVSSAQGSNAALVEWTDHSTGKIYYSTPSYLQTLKAGSPDLSQVWLKN